MPEVHLTYGGSTATRTLMCPNWVNISAVVEQPEEEEMDLEAILADPKLIGRAIREANAAQRGSILHAVMEGVYDLDLDLEPLIAYMPEDDQDAARSAVKALDSMMNAKDMDDYIVEQMVTLSEDEGGSADIIACSDTQVAVVDFKFGYQPIKDRNQMMLYACAGAETAEVADMFGDRKVLSVVVQPAVSELPMVAVHEPSDLAQFRLDWDAAVALSREGGMEGNPGDHCKYCPGATVCPAKRKQVAVFANLDPKVGADLATGMSMLEQMKDQIKALEAECYAALERGQAVPGWKLVLKRSTRKFKDPEAVRKKFRYSKTITKGMYLEEPALKSVAQVEKALKKAGIEYDLESLVDDTAPGTTIAPESDKRPAIEIGSVPEALDAILKGE